VRKSPLLSWEGGVPLSGGGTEILVFVQGVKNMQISVLGGLGEKYGGVYKDDHRG